MPGDSVVIRPTSGAHLARAAVVSLASFAALALAFAACSTAEPLTCPVPAATACPSLDGVTSFCAWSQWGCAPEAACGGYFVLQDQATGSRFTYYYAAASGQFAATVKEAFQGGEATCLAGPASFQVPSGCDMDTLADCAPPPRDGGVGGGSDATVDAPFSAPSPSGSPSNQPFFAPLAPPARP